jgi:hypothetical protein
MPTSNASETNASGGPYDDTILHNGGKTLHRLSFEHHLPYFRNPERSVHKLQRKHHTLDDVNPTLEA